MREARGKSSEWSARAEGMAPNCGVRENHAKVWFRSRKWEPLQTEDGDGATGWQVVVGGLLAAACAVGWKRRGRFARIAWAGNTAVAVSGARSRGKEDARMVVEDGGVICVGHLRGLHNLNVAES